MTYSPNDHSRLVEYVEERWGPNQRAWASPRLWEEFSEFTTGCVFQSIRELFNEGRRYAPNAAELKAHCRDVQKRRIDSGEDPRPSRECAGKHVWGVLPEWEQRQERERQGKPDSVRLSVCALCRTEDWSPRETVGEAGSEPAKETAA